MDIEKIKQDFEAYQEFITVCEIADKETAKSLRIFEGDKYNTKKIPQTKEDAFERFNEYDVIKIFIHFIEEFNKYPMNHKRLTDELETINEWISDAKKIKFDEAINIYNKNFNASKDMQNEYVKLFCNYYDNKDFFSYFSFFGNNAFHIKAKYFLYKDWLENEICKIEKKQVEIEPAETEPKYTFKTTLKHIALKAYYEEKHITESNASMFLKGTKFKSGKKLSQFYTFYRDNTDRRANPESKTMLKNKIKLFEEVAVLLPDNMRFKVIDETKHLKNFMSLY